jgi:hypothetical protein
MRERPVRRPASQRDRFLRRQQYLDSSYKAGSAPPTSPGSRFVSLMPLGRRLICGLDFPYPVVGSRHPCRARVVAISSSGRSVALNRLAKIRHHRRCHPPARRARWESFYGGVPGLADSQGAYPLRRRHRRLDPPVAVALQRSGRWARHTSTACTTKMSRSPKTAG